MYHFRIKFFYRILSAWFYRGHSPNLDFFSVRPEFKEIAEGKRPRVQFQEYIEMPEYQNIQTRMLGADSFPYRNVTVNEEVSIVQLFCFIISSSSCLLIILDNEQFLFVHVTIKLLYIQRRKYMTGHLEFIICINYLSEHLRLYVLHLFFDFISSFNYFFLIFPLSFVF